MTDRLIRCDRCRLQALIRPDAADATEAAWRAAHTGERRPRPDRNTT